jgi:fumarate hydratase class I
MGVSCSADRNVKAKITREGTFLERLEREPAKYLPEPVSQDADAVRIDLNRPMDDIRAELSKFPVSTRLLLTGKIVVARDIAHARLNERLLRGEGLPQFVKDHIIYYAGPAKTPAGYASGSFGPTTAGRMDPYVPEFQAQGGSLVMLAKGNRSKIVTESCNKFGGFYLGSIGGPAARLGKECITAVDIIAYPELGMEAIYQITVKDFPAFIIVDDKGNDFFENLL